MFSGDDLLRAASRFLATASAATALSLPADAADAAAEAAVDAFSLPTVAADDATWNACDVLTFSLPAAAATVADWNACDVLATFSACMPFSLPTVATVSAAKKSVLPARLAITLKLSIVVSILDAGRWLLDVRWLLDAGRDGNGGATQVRVCWFVRLFVCRFRLDLALDSLLFRPAGHNSTVHSAGTVGRRDGEGPNPRVEK